MDTRISLLVQEVSDSWTAAGEDSEEVSQHAYPDPAHRSVLEDSGMDLWSHLVQFCTHNVCMSSFLMPFFGPHLLNFSLWNSESFMGM